MLLFMDGMAHYATGELERKYSAVNHTACAWSVVAEGRFGNCLKRVSTNNTTDCGYVSIAPLTTRLGVWAPTTGGVCGFAIKVDNLVRCQTSQVHTSTPRGLLGILEGEMYHVTLHLNPDGTFTLVQNENTFTGGITVLAQSVEGLTSGAWAYVECKWVIDAVAGSFVVRVNGVQVLTYTGITRETWLNTTLGVWNAVRIGMVQSTPTNFLLMRFCDLYLADLAGADPEDVSDFLGDGIVSTIVPNGPGSTTGWGPTPAPNWDAVNDRPAPDGDTTYVQTTAPGTVDRYAFEDIPPGTVVKGVHLNILARKLTEGASTLAPVVNATLGPTQGVATITYDRYLTQAWDLNPATGAKFTADEINAAQFGMQKIS